MDKYAVFGHPIKQSKSPIIHRQFAQQTKQELEYSAIDPGVDNFSQAITTFKQQGGKGCNVTMPFKEQAYNLADHLTERAQLAGAVNTLTFNADGTIAADNTDGAGLVNDLIANHAPLNKRILLIGAGGAARGVIKPLLDCNPQSLTLVNRTFEKAQILADMFQPFGVVEVVDLENITGAHQFDLVINSTSTSLSNQLPPVPITIFAPNSFAYDMVYQDKPTSFLLWASNNGAAKCVDGLGMLIGQAAESFKVWRQITPEQKPVLANIRKSLGLQ